jgi:hypothetical protein
MIMDEPKKSKKTKKIAFLGSIIKINKTRI